MKTRRNFFKTVLATALSAPLLVKELCRPLVEIQPEPAGYTCNNFDGWIVTSYGNMTVSYTRIRSDGNVVVFTPLAPTATPECLKQLMESL